MAGTSPTARTLKLLRDLGARAGVVERWNFRLMKRQGPGPVLAQLLRRVDLFGWIDVVAVIPHRVAIRAPSDVGGFNLWTGLYGIQCTDGSSASARVKKLSELDDDNAQALTDWLDVGGRLEVWSWAKRGAAGKRKLWTPRRTLIGPEHLAEDKPF